jgi:flagellar motor switch/type III secretory pathway protein FliN
MLMTSSLALTGLRQISPDHAQLSKMMLALLSGETTDSHMPLVSCLSGSQSGDWVNCGEGLFLRIGVAGGCPYVFRENRLAEMVNALDAAEPILSEIEHRCGFALDPAEAVSALPEHSLIIQVSSVDGQHLIHLALSPDFLAPPAFHTMFDGLKIDWSNVPVAFGIQISGPLLSVEIAAAIETGDLILIGGMASAVRLIWPAEITQQRKVTGIYNMFNGQFTANEKGSTMEPGAENSANANLPLEFSVPISIQLPNRMTSAAELSQMRPGTTLNIGAVAQGLPVSILVGNQEIARGELVQVGDQFAVLVEQKIVHNEQQSDLTEAAVGSE